MCEYGDVRVISYARVVRSQCASEYEMCECDDVIVEMPEWSGLNVRVNMKCANASTVKCEWSSHNVRVR